jgi:protein-S-isoprenylcysteine O-methyltransferase Ste14
MMPGMENLVAHLPDGRSGRGGVFGLIILVSFFVATAALVGLDRQWPAWTGLEQVGVIIIGFIWTGQFFWRRRAYRARWGDLAYQKAFKKHILVGLPVIFAAIAHTAYLPGQRLPLGWAAPLVAGLGVYLAVTGLVLWGRAIFTFGFDNLAMLYVYFPEEGRLVESSIYGIIRHPVYAAVIRIGLVLGLWRGTWFSIAFGLFMPLGLALWLRLVEEPELIERFGPGYAAYRRHVPAFWPRPRDAGKFFQFLITGR